MKKIVPVFLILIHYFNSFAQKTDKTVESMITAEKRFNEKGKKESIKKSFLEIMDLNCIVFKPGPILAKDFYNNHDVLGKLSWKPEFAMIAKSGDFGFTTGPFIYNDFEKKNYGHYLSVWKADKSKKWKLILNADIPHQQIASELPKVFLNPDNYRYPKMIGPQKIKMREDIVFSTDELLGKSLMKSGNAGLMEFYDNSVRLYFPNHLPAFGKVDVLRFIKTQKLNITSKPIVTERAFSGDLAYTYGEAVINTSKYYYIRIWQIDEEKKWNIIVDSYLANQIN